MTCNKTGIGCEGWRWVPSPNVQERKNMEKKRVVSAINRFYQLIEMEVIPISAFDLFIRKVDQKFE